MVWKDNCLFLLNLPPFPSATVTHVQELDQLISDQILNMCKKKVSLVSRIQFLIQLNLCKETTCGSLPVPNEA